MSRDVTEYIDTLRATLVAHSTLEDDSSDKGDHIHDDINLVDVVPSLTSFITLDARATPSHLLQLPMRIANESIVNPKP